MSKKVSESELLAFSKYIEEACGIVLDGGKGYLIESRLGPLLEKNGCNTYSDLHRKAMSDATGKTRNLVVDAISTQETSFFRDSHPFELLTHKILPDHFEKEKANGGNSLTIWSAASSTGQEIYSIAITIKRLLYDLSKHKIRLLGTDISDTALTLASAARYTKLELSRGMSADYLQRYFTKDGNVFRLNDELRALAFFQKVNLLDPKGIVGRFNIVFCRNVAIYFSKENRHILFNELANRLTPDGILFIGSTESLIGITDRFEKQEFRGKTYYRKIK